MVAADLTASCRTSRTSFGAAWCVLCLSFHHATLKPCITRRAVSGDGRLEANTTFAYLAEVAEEQAGGVVQRSVGEHLWRIDQTPVSTAAVDRVRTVEPGGARSRAPASRTAAKTAPVG